jgi:hypothetical protein
LKYGEESLVFAFENIRTVETMRVGDGTREILALSYHLHVAQAPKRLDEVIRAIVPADGFQSIRHALCGLDK